MPFTLSLIRFGVFLECVFVAISFFAIKPTLCFLFKPTGFFIILKMIRGGKYITFCPGAVNLNVRLP